MKIIEVRITKDMPLEIRNTMISEYDNMAKKGFFEKTVDPETLDEVYLPTKKAHRLMKNAKDSAKKELKE